MGIMDKIPWKELEDFAEKTVGKTFDTVFSSMDSQEDEVKAKMDADLAKSRDLLADEIIYESCKKTGLIGVGAAAPDMLLGVDWPLMVASMGADFTLTLREDLAMLAKLAYLYGQENSRELRKREAIGLLAMVKASEGDTKGNASAEVAKMMAMMGAKHVSQRVMKNLIKEIFKKWIKKKFAMVVPGLGIAISGGVNFTSTRALGEYAKAYYQKKKVGNAEVDAIVSEIQRFQKCFLQVMINMAKIDKKIPREEEDLLKDSLLMFGFNREEQDAYFRELYNLDVMNPVTPEDVKRLSEDDKRYILKQAMAMMLVDRKSSMAEKTYLDMLRKLFNISQESVASLQKEVEEELGSAEDEGA